MPVCTGGIGLARSRRGAVPTARSRVHSADSASMVAARSGHCGGGISADPLRMATIQTGGRHVAFFSPSDLNDHIFEASGVFIQHFAPVFADHDSVRVSNASPVGIVDSRLAAESHAPLEDGLVAFGDPWGFVAFETNAVTSAVFEELLESGFADLVETLVIDFFSDRSFLQILDSGVVGGEHCVVEALGVVGWLADDERPLALDGIGDKLAGHGGDEGLSFFEAVLARDGMRKSGALAERHQTSERRINPYADDVFQPRCPFVGERVGGGFQDFVFANSAMRMPEVTD